MGQECNAISYDNKVQNTTGRSKTFLKLEYKWRGKNLTLKRYKGKLYLTNEKTMCMHFITKRSIKIHLE